MNPDEIALLVRRREQLRANIRWLDARGQFAGRDAARKDLSLIERRLAGARDRVHHLA
jgi:hypothetical protein